MRSDNPDEFIDMLLARLERVQADSCWAHQASGVRGSLLRAVETMEIGQDIEEAQIKQTMEAGFHILAEAAKERAYSGPRSTPSNLIKGVIHQQAS
jgi:hypothetical protein